MSIPAAAAELIVPDDFKCPISLEIMSDPVILPSGHTFDRPSIQRWLDAGHLTCPITNLPLPHNPPLIPNHTLRSLISNHYPTNNHHHHHHHHCDNPQTLIHLLTSPSTSAADKLASLAQLARLSSRHSSTRKRLAECGAVSPILNCVDPTEPQGLQEKALHLLLNLSLDDDTKVGLVAEGIVGKVVHALRYGMGDSRAVAATLLTSLAMLEVNKVTIGSYPDAIPGLVTLLRVGNARERREAATALFTLCSFSDNRVRAVESGAVESLVRCAESGLERAVEVLGVLTRCEAGREEMVRCAGVLDVLIGVMRSGGGSSSRGVQYALLTLSCLCCYSRKLGLEAVRGGVFEMCVGLLEDENEKVRRNAKVLILVLQGKRKNVSFRKL